MNVDRLKALLPEVRDVASLYRNFAAEHGVADVTAFLANLADKGLLAEDAVRRAVAEVEAGFTLNDRGSVTGPPPRRKGPRFRSLSMLGRGAMGEVWLARDRDLNRVVAVKRMDAAIASDAAMQARFYTEVRITAQLDHPGVVAVYGLEYDADDLPTYAMKVVRGKNLQDLLTASVNARRDGKEPPEEASFRTLLELFVQICHTLAYASDRGVVHRDLKPENIMVGAHHEVIVMDWGIAKLVGDAEAARAEPGARSSGGGTEWGVAIGTPLYMSPEQANGENDTLDGKSDQFSLGLILYEICCGKKAYTGKTVPQILLRAADGDLDPIRGADGQAVPRELEAVIRRATQRAPADRYPSCADLADDVRRFLRDEPVQAAPDTRVQGAARWVAKNRQLALAIGVALAALVLAVVAGGTVLGLGAVAAQRYAAAEREAHLAAVISAVSAQGRRIDGRFLHYMGEVRALGAAAEYALAHEPGQRTPYFTVDYPDAGKRPPDAVMSSRYHGWLSVDETDTLVVGARWEDVTREGQQIIGLEPQLQRALFESEGPKVLGATAAARQRLIEDGLPVVWAYYGLESGLVVTYPGTETLPEPGYDHRAQAWYEVGRRAETPMWGPAATDETGMGLLMPVVVAIHGPDRRFTGVASMDLSITYVVDSLLKPRGITAPTNAYFVNPSGKVVASTQLDATKYRQISDMERFPIEAPLTAMLSGSQPAGWQVVRVDGKDQMVVWVPLEAIGWWYVVVGDEAELLGAK